jgi:F-type H+-transporting ATPase subunit epsilon
MRLRVLAPDHVAVDAGVDKVVAEAGDGVFCLLPRHLDMATTLVPSLLSYTVDGEEHHLAVDGGTLVKCGSQVMVSTPRVVRSRSLADLRRAVDESFRVAREREHTARAALARLESDVIRRFVELEHHVRQ